MRALVPLLALALLLPLAPASAEGGGSCWWLTFDHELCVGQEGDCIGVLYRDYVAGRETCIGVDEDWIGPLA